MNPLQLHTSIYSAQAVERGVQAFSDYGTFEVTPDSAADYILVSITASPNIDEAELRGEFGNYVLAASIESTGAAE